MSLELTQETNEAYSYRISHHWGYAYIDNINFIIKHFNLTRLIDKCLSQVRSNEIDICCLYDNEGMDNFRLDDFCHKSKTPHIQHTGYELSISSSVLVVDCEQHDVRLNGQFKINFCPEFISISIMSLRGYANIENANDILKALKCLVPD